VNHLSSVNYNFEELKKIIERDVIYNYANACLYFNGLFGDIKCNYNRGYDSIIILVFAAVMSLMS